MKKKQIHCPYCGAKASLRPASVVYGEATKVPTAICMYATVIPNATPM